MAAVGGASLTVCLCVLLLPAATGLQSEDRQCAFSDQLQGAEPHSGPTNELRGVVRENGTVRCIRGSSCYGLWENKPDGEIHLVKQGCWTHIGNQQECHGARCLVTATPTQMQSGSYRFCCCSRDLCNANFTEAPPTDDTPALSPVKTGGQGVRQTDHQPLRQEDMVLIALATVAIAAVVIVALFLGYRMMKGKQKLSLSALDVMETANTDTVDLDHLKLLELIGRGRYGTVFRGRLNDRCVAVKLFSAADRLNFFSERSIYSLLLQHDNIARFLSADERTAADGRPEYLILMEYYPLGCLSRYLSVHTVDWSTCCRMTHGVTRGLAFLHTELYRGDQYKPAVAHRDVTSRNVLVRADLSCVLADFGLSMRLTGSRRPGDDDTASISEVGTVRYMAPEVLGGALNLRDCESALKQVDVYALGLLYWESFRRCSHLSPVPEHQLAFQAELGNHPSFEDMQVLVSRDKFRPRFPESWKENSLALRSLKETMEDCWDQDAEARLTAQCAEERLWDLSLLTTHSHRYTHTHTLTHTHPNNDLMPGPSLRNPSQGHWPPQEDLQVGVVKNLQGDGGPAESSERNRNSINYERQQVQVRSSTNVTPPSTLCNISESGVPVSTAPVCLQLTEEDLEAIKLDPNEVEKNLRESSDENLMEHSQKQFGSPEHRAASHQILQTEVHSSVLAVQGDQGVVGQVDTPPSSSGHPLPKQQNLPQRPTSLHLLHKTKDSSSRLKLGKLKSNHRQVETGVAKMNTVTVALAAEPHQVMTVTNNTSSTRGGETCGRAPFKFVVAKSSSASVPALVTNGVTGGGQTNPAGPQLEDEDKMEGVGLAGQDDRCMNLLNSSPDEHEPLLKREQPPAESEPLPPLHHHRQSQAGNIGSGKGSNYNNNNNNRSTLGSKWKIQGLKVEPGSEVRQDRSITSSKPEPHPARRAPSDRDPAPQDRGYGSDLFVKRACLVEPVLTSESARSPKMVHSLATALVPDHPVSLPVPEGLGSPASHVKDPNTSNSYSTARVSDALTLGPEKQAFKPSDSDPTQSPIGNPKASVSEVQVSANQHSGTPAEASALEPGPLEIPALVPRTQGVLQIQVGPARAKRRERPCSLDLSSSCISSEDVSLTDNHSLSVSGEKIKRRIKTPYTLKKWRPASLVVSTDTAMDPDFRFNTRVGSSSQTHLPSGLHRAGSIGFPKINQSKSSMAVFLVGGGATATATSEPDGVTSF
ncbi:bone morphogenetic protein receptor type-2-like isoform X2 [Pseudoliparis swirei]|uniref:bone morphogenetic protein receptor type-2-like isoform X2 n=1 Tax=Pseudoliparis swirei TaxID=2059687 RepID=UPI0024BDD8A8|nr:bone morphogenetic protein receptor type-2-like isoform X2 [Pseudoliparis swirei]